MDLLVLFFGFAMMMCYLAVLFRVLTLKQGDTFCDKKQLSKKCAKHQNDGYECEIQFNRELKLYLGKGDYLIRNLVLKRNKQIIGEIDSVLVSRKGLFCIEIKSTRGTGKGSDTTLHWRFKKNTNAKGHSNVENPVMQNERHCEILEKNLGYRYLSKNIVVFPFAKDIKNIKSKNVFTTDTFLKYYRSLRRNKLSRKDVLEIVDRLNANNEVSHQQETLKRLSREQMSNFQLS